MIRLLLLKHKPQRGVKYIKQMWDNDTGMTHSFSIWNGQHEIRYTIPYIYLRAKCLIKHINHHEWFKTDTGYKPE